MNTSAKMAMCGRPKKGVKKYSGWGLGKSIKNFKLLKCAVLVFLSTFVMMGQFADAAPNEPSDFKILTYNVHLFEDS